ncbi:MAG: hypothetical protein R8P61_05980 [Bacteroidia bacterium]|nr:hypothetical protein [Bacteroidia bacterium]
MNLKHIFSKGPKSPEDKAERFWKWFAKNQQQFLFITSVSVEEKDRMLNEFLEELHKYDENLYFEMGGHPDDQKVELIITAEGNIEAFPSVELLVGKAPSFESWEVIAFKPPMGTGFTTEYGGYSFDPEKILFIPLKNPDNPQAIGLKVCYPDYREEDRNIFINGSFIMLDVILGEKSCVEDIDYLDAAQTPENIVDYPFRSLSNIKSYIDEVKAR